MFWIALAVVLVVGYGIINGRRNADPLNRKAAAEICEYLTGPGEQSDPVEIARILQNNARYRRQAKHVASMVPVLLKEAGVPWEVARHTHTTVSNAAELLPK